MSTQRLAKKGKLWWAVVVMFVISCVLTASGGMLSLFASLDIILGVCGIVVTMLAWLLTLDL
jgi:hypothetical protein